MKKWISILCALLPMIGVAQILTLSYADPNSQVYHFYPFNGPNGFQDADPASANNPWPSSINITGVHSMEVTWNAPAGYMYVLRPPTNGTLNLDFILAYGGFNSDSSSLGSITNVNTTFGMVYGTAPVVSHLSWNYGSSQGLYINEQAAITSTMTNFAFTNFTAHVDFDGTSPSGSLGFSASPSMYFVNLIGYQPVDPGQLLTLQPLPNNNPTNYWLDWFKVAGGGGTMTGDVYTASVTIGQPDAGGPMQGPGYSVEGGFWSLYREGRSSVDGYAPTIVTQPEGLIITDGLVASLYLTAWTGDFPIFFQWQKNGGNLIDDRRVSGSTFSTLSFRPINTNDAGSYTLILCNAYGCVTSSVAKVTVVVEKIATFEGLPTGKGIVKGYTDLYWDNFYSLASGEYPNSGYYYGTISPTNVAYNAFGTPAYVSNSVPFDFVSAYLTAAWNDNLQVQVEGFAGPAMVYSNTYILSATNPTLINFNYFGVNKVYFSSFGGTQHPGYTGTGGHFAMDNLNLGGGSLFPQLKNAMKSSGNLQFSWAALNAYPSVSYQVQYTTNLSSGIWSNLDLVIGPAGSTLSFTNSTSADPQRFYRLLLVQ